jgi:DNA uptake protein ComE-like DNA-binding protein
MSQAEKNREVDLNTTDFDTLKQMPMVGEKRADFIFNHRPYTNWDDLKNKVPGISDGMIDDLKRGGAIIREK